MKDAFKWTIESSHVKCTSSFLWERISSFLFHLSCLTSIKNNEFCRTSDKGINLKQTLETKKKLNRLASNSICTPSHSLSNSSLILSLRSTSISHKKIISAMLSLLLFGVRKEVPNCWLKKNIVLIGSSLLIFVSSIG